MATQWTKTACASPFTFASTTAASWAQRKRDCGNTKYEHQSRTHGSVCVCFFFLSVWVWVRAVCGQCAGAHGCLNMVQLLRRSGSGWWPGSLAVHESVAGTKSVSHSALRTNCHTDSRTNRQTNRRTNGQTD